MLENQILASAGIEKTEGNHTFFLELIELEFGKKMPFIFMYFLKLFIIMLA